MSPLGFHHSEETKAKMRGNQYAIGHHHTEEIRARISATHKGNKNALGLRHSNETRAKMSASHKLQWQDPVYRMKVFAGVIGKKRSERTKARISAALKGRFISDSHLRNWIKANQIKPNKVELRLQDILDRHYPNQWKYVGDGQIIIGGRCPDFINVDGKKEIIELFGTHWHPPFDVANRKEHYTQYGFRSAIIWEDELDDEKRLIKVLRRKFR